MNSDRTRVVWRTGTGDQYILRRRGRNAFQDDALDALVGTTITAVGMALDWTFIINEWTVEHRK